MYYKYVNRKFSISFIFQHNVYLLCYYDRKYERVHIRKWLLKKRNIPKNRKEYIVQTITFFFKGGGNRPL